eukprot:jgi/Botrbrau1/4163/Bobra.0192s0031.1
MGNLAEAEALFRNQWSTYQKVLEGNYLFHQELYQPFKDAFLNKQSLRVLDLGCGDSVYFCKSIEASGCAANVRQYTGVDMSAAALQIAQRNLKSCLPANAEMNFVVDDMAHFVKGASEKYEIILVSFALHHLSLAQKIQFVADVRQLLAGNGEVYVIDIFLR